MFKKTLSILISVLLLLSSGCGGGGQTTDQPPEVPPASTFVIDFSDFQQADEGGRLALQSTYENWGFAATNIVIWNTVLATTLSIPVAAFVESFNHEPAQQEDGSWLWTYDYSVGVATYTAELSGLVQSGDIHWTMLITNQGQYEDFEWFTGESNLAGTEGTWSLNLSPNNPAPFIDIEWHLQQADVVADVKYTNVIPGDDDNGSTIFYGINTDTPYNAFYEIASVPLNSTINIEWNRDSKAGQVMGELHFENTDFHCWDDTLADVSCE